MHRLAFGSGVLAALALVMVTAAGDSSSEMFGDPASSGEFDGDLGGDNLSDSTDNTVDLATGEDLCGLNATCIDLDTDGDVKIDNAATGASDIDIQMGTAALAPIINGEASNIAFDAVNGTNKINLSAASYIVEQTVGGADTAHLTVGGNLALRDPTSTTGGLICWSDNATAAVDCKMYFGGEYVSATEHFVAAMDSSWSPAAPPTSTFKVGDMDPNSRARVGCDIAASGIINYDYDVADNDDTGLMDACVQENSGGATGYVWRSVVDAYAEIKWHDNSTATTISACEAADWSNEVAVAGGAVDESNGFSKSGSVLTVYPSAAGRWQAVIGFSFTGGTGDTYEFALKIDDGAAPVYECNYERTMGATALIGSASSTCIFDTASGDTISLYVQQTNAGCSNVTVSEGSVVLRRL